MTITSLDLCLRLEKQGCSPVGTIKSNRMKILKNLKETCSLYYTTIIKLAYAAVSTVAITKYHCKQSNFVNMLGLCQPNVAIPFENNPKQHFLQRN